MTRYEFQRPCRAGLLDNLIAAGFPPLTVVEMDDTCCWVTCEPEDYDRVVAVVAAFDATAVDQAATTTKVARRADIVGLRAYLNVATPTQAQTVSALKALIRVVARDVRED